MPEPARAWLEARQGILPVRLKFLALGLGEELEAGVGVQLRAVRRAAMPPDLVGKKDEGPNRQELFRREVVARFRTIHFHGEGLLNTTRCCSGPLRPVLRFKPRLSLASTRKQARHCLVISVIANDIGKNA